MDRWRQDHWDERYRTVGATAASWAEPVPHLSLALLELVGSGPSDAVLDVGGGAATLAGRLVDRGYDDVTVLDVSEAALAEARTATPHAGRISWVHADLLGWRPDRVVDVWHDRAVFHFLTDAAERARYRRTLRATVAPGGAVLVTTFADDGPTQCSGLDVARYPPEALRDELGPDLVEVARGRYLHHTPSGVPQPFAWLAARLPD